MCIAILNMVENNGSLRSLSVLPTNPGCLADLLTVRPSHSTMNSESHASAENGQLISGKS